MQLLKKNGIILFWAVLFLDCFLLYNEEYSYHSYLKAALMPILMLHVFLNARKKHYLVSKSLVFMGLFFAWIADILLLNEGKGFFVWGMLGFVVMHLFYIVFFFRLNPLNLLKGSEALLAAIILFAVNYQLYKFMKPEFVQMPNLKLSLFGYTVVMSLMAVLATNVFANRTKRPLTISYFIPGAALFIFSHAILVIGKFKYPDESYLVVVSTISYGYAQCLLAQGFAKHLKG